MTENSQGYAAAAAKAAEQARNDAMEVQQRLAEPRGRLKTLALQYAERLTAAGETIEAASKATPPFNRWEHNFKQRLYKLDAIEAGRVIFELIDTDSGDGVQAHPITSLQIFDPFRDEAVVKEIGRGSGYPKWDFRPDGSKMIPRYASDVSKSPLCFAVTVPWIRSFEYRIGLRARLGEKLSAERIEQMKREIDADGEIWARMALFLDGQIDEAMAFCAHVLDAAHESQTLVAGRASAHLERYPQSSPPKAAARAKSSSLLWIVLGGGGLALVGFLALQFFQ